jgi:hypothetical protein
MNSVLIEAQYLPPLAYFTAIRGAEKIIIERHEYYIKQSYRNRCYINTTSGRQHLIVPLTAKHGKPLIDEVQIDYQQKWLNNHWRTIRSAYANAPFFEYYADDLEKILFSKPTCLYDLNFELLSMCLKWLKWNIPVVETLSYEKELPDVKDLRSLINPKKTGLLAEFFTPVPYTQVFGATFEENLSIIDLIFCVGPAAAGVVSNSTVAK